MADVGIDTSIGATATARGMRSIVFTTKDIGYCFYIDTGGTNFVYSKTTDGGATWGAAEVVFTSSNTFIFDVWFDRWTPGIDGTLIHTWYANTTADTVFWRTLDTATDTLGTQRTVFVTALSPSAAPGRGTFVSGTKTRSGYLYCAFDIDAGQEMGLLRSTNSGTTWDSLSVTSSGAVVFIEATLDQCLLFPASNTGDNDDCWAVYHDASDDALTLKMWDSTAIAAVESGSSISVAENVTDGTGQYGFSASVRHSDGHLILACMSAYDLGTNHKIYDINGTGSLTEKTAIASNTHDHYYPQVFIDQATDAIYVFYNGKRDGSEELGTMTKVYYTKSTDGGTSWTAGDTAYMVNAVGVVVQVEAPLMGLRLYAGYRIGSELLGSNASSIDLTPPLTPQRFGLGLGLGL